MSSRPPSRPQSRSTHSSQSAPRQHALVRQTPPPTTLTPESTEHDFEPCAATASFLLYAQRNVILVLHHDSLTIERRLELHREDVKWIAVDNVSERGSGRLAVSFDAGRTAIVWDILNGREVARFSAYENIKVASFMRNGNIAFGNDQGNVILFETSTSEHISARTIFDPITALAPAADCRTFAIGYLNGSILIATLQPSFTILHTLNSTRAPSKISGLAWHGSSSKQKTDMLATQTQDGDLRVWSVPKDAAEMPNIIRVLQRSEVGQPGPGWFAWSKNGRLLQLIDGETRSWDVRTKKVTYDIIPTIDGVQGVANYGPSAILFTLGRNHTVQQYDVNPSTAPLQIATAQHVPANTPPTPPINSDHDRPGYGRYGTSGIGNKSIAQTFTDEESSTDEGANLSPLQKIAREWDSLDALESELRDKVMPLSPHSSQASSISSRGSGKSRRRDRKYLYDRPDSSRASTGTGQDGTEFSFQLPSRNAHESMSIRSVSSYANHATGPSNLRTSNLRNQARRGSEESREEATIDLFPFTKARLREVSFRTPHYGDIARTPELLQREMLSVVFGWHDDIYALINDEVYRHRPGSASGVLLSRWLGEIGADDMSAMIGSESMTSSDWMLLALTSLGQDSKKKAAEAFVQRLLEKGDIHPAVTVLLGLGEVEDAIEVYISQSYWMEAVLLTCLVRESNWKRISYLLRKWGEAAVIAGDAELAVRCFSCISIETSAPWSSPNAQGAIFEAQNRQQSQPQSAGSAMSPAFSPPSRTASGRLTAKNASLKLITTFGDKAAALELKGGDLSRPPDSTLSVGVTPIGMSAAPGSALPSSAHPASPGGLAPWKHGLGRSVPEAASARTATPGGWSRRKRLPSRGDIDRAKQEAAILATPLTASIAPKSQRSSSVSSVPEPTTALRPTVFGGDQSQFTASDSRRPLPSPSPGVFTRGIGESRSRAASRAREGQSNRLEVQVPETEYMDARSPVGVHKPRAATVDIGHGGTLSPPLTGDSSKASSRGGRATDEHINSVDQARTAARKERAESRRRGESRKRGESRSGRESSRVRESSEARGRTAANVRYIKPAKRSPSSPVPMSPQEIAQASRGNTIEPATTDDESFYKVSLQSPVESQRSGRSQRSESKHRRMRPSEDNSSRGDHPLRTSSRARRGRSPESLAAEADDGRGRSARREVGSTTRSPSSPLPVLSDAKFEAETFTDGQRFRLRSQSANRKFEDLQARRQESRDRRERSSSRKPMSRDDTNTGATSLMRDVILEEHASQISHTATSSLSGASDSRSTLSKKELAARELEERRKSLARRPSAPQIPLPGEMLQSPGSRPSMTPRSNTDLGDSPTSYLPPMSRSQTVDPAAMSRYGTLNKITGTSTPSAPIGLPATPRAMRHTRYMGSDPDEREGTPPVPDIPGKFSDLGSLSGSALSQVTESNLSAVSSYIPPPEHWKSSVLTDQSKFTALTDQTKSAVSAASDNAGPLLPSTTYNQKEPVSATTTSEPGLQGGMVHPLYRTGLPSSNRRLSHVRKISPPEVTNRADGLESVNSIDAALHGKDDDVVIVHGTDTSADPPILPELQHLAIPPPPPPMIFPPHGGSGVINIAIDERPLGAGPEDKELTFPQPMERASTTSPTQHKRHQGSVGETFGSRFRGIGDRMRSSSRNRTKSPQVDGKSTMPYETVLPPIPSHRRHDSLGAYRAQSPYEQAMAAQSSQNTPRLANGAVAVSATEAKLNETSIPPSSLPGSRSGSTVNGYRSAREIRANMPPDQTQQGAYEHGGFL